MTTYEVTKEQFDLLEKAKESEFVLVNAIDIYTEFVEATTGEFQKAILRYIGGDETFKFKVKEKMYKLARIDRKGDRVYARINAWGTPDWTTSDEYAFKAPLEEIKKWKTPAWEIEEVTK